MPAKKASKKEAKSESKWFCRGKDDKCCKSSGCGGCAGCAYFLGFIGAAVFYIKASTGFWMGVVGFLKAIVWPAFLVFHLLGL